VTVGLELELEGIDGDGLGGQARMSEVAEAAVPGVFHGLVRQMEDTWQAGLFARLLGRPGHVLVVSGAHG
jgi:hypothetical protein